MKFIVQIIISTLSLLVTDYLFPWVDIDDHSFFTALTVAVVLAFINSVVKPIMVLITIPITLISLGLFMAVINACVILMADYVVDGFHVSGFWSALFFSIFLSGVTAFFSSFQDE